MSTEGNVSRELTQQEKDLLRIEQFRLMDDDFFSEALDEKNEAVGFILNTILERYHSSMIDRTLLSKNEDFEDLSDTYVIFITENDKFGKGKPLYHIERKIEEMDDALFDDGAHIIYVNGEFQDPDHPVGRLMHDFHCTKAEDMYSSVLADEVRYLKETEGGRSHMCKVMEEMREEAALEAKHRQAVETALKMLADGFSHKDVARYNGLTLTEVEELTGQKTA